MEKPTYAVLTPAEGQDDAWPPAVVALAEYHIPPTGIILKENQMAMRINSRVIANFAPISPRAYKFLKPLKNVLFISLKSDGSILGETRIPVESVS